MDPSIPLQPRKLPRQARSRALVDSLLEATARVLVSEGFTNTTTNTIADVAGVSVGSLYQYFPNKESLVFAVAHQHFAEMTGQLESVALAAPTRPVPEVVREFVHAMVQAHLVDPELHQAISQLVFAHGFQVVDEVQARALGLVRAWLELRRDELRIADLDHAAFLLVTTVEAAVHGPLLVGPERLQDPAYEDEIVDLVLRYLIA